jgi:hypothetical protein
MLTTEQVSEIKTLINENELTFQEIGEKFDVSRGCISGIACNKVKAYKDVEPQVLYQRISGGTPKAPNIETQNLALRGQLENMRKERNMLKRQLNAAAARFSIVDDIVEQLSPVIVPLKPAKPYAAKKNGTIDEACGLLFSDNHLDQVVSPAEVDGLEHYNFPIGVRRHEKLAEETIKWTQRSLTNFNFHKLVVCGLGDYTSGPIHGHEHRSYYGSWVYNDLAIAQVFAQMLRELAAYFPVIEVVSIIGNHGRITDRIEFTKEAVASNHDTMIMRIAEAYLVDCENIQFEFPAGLSTVKSIEGWNFFLHHGHGKKGSSETWARAKRKSQTIVPLHARTGAIDYFASGHFHTPGDVAVSGGATMLGNGAFLACDQYMFGIHRKNGVTWRLPINVRCPEEKSGPQRYSILEKPV